MRAQYGLFLMLIFILSGCKPEAQDSQEELDKFGQDNGGPVSCNLTELGLEQSLGSPQSINDMVELINALPRPLNVPCVLSALNRPLKINLTNSSRSAQPANGNENPRIFIMNFPLILSMTIDGGGAYFIEISEYTSNTHSIKGELKFPIYDTVIDVSKPLTKIETGFASACVGCHIQEEKINVADYPIPVYESVAIRPTMNEKVEINAFKGELYKCEYLSNPDYRCLMVTSLFNHGELVWQDFPLETPTFLETFNL